MKLNICFSWIINSEVLPKFWVIDIDMRDVAQADCQEIHSAEVFLQYLSVHYPFHF